MPHKDPEAAKAYFKQYGVSNKQRIRVKRAEYYQANKDKNKEQCKRYREENKAAINERLARTRDHRLATMKQYREKHQNERREYDASYRAKNKDKIREQKAQYRAANRERINASRRQHYLDNRERILKEAYVRNRTPAHRFRILKRTARDRGLPVEINYEEYCQLIVKGVCHYCYCPLNETGYGLDRKNNLLGYTRDNLVPCCDRCNTCFMHYFTYPEKLLLAETIRQIDCSRIRPVSHPSSAQSPSPSTGE